MPDHPAVPIFLRTNQGKWISVEPQILTAPLSWVRVSD